MRNNQVSLFPNVVANKVTHKTPTTFKDNAKLPIHRWFKYSAGFSAEWVRKLINEAQIEGRQTVFDPFLGSGTVSVEAELMGMKSISSESHPFISRVAQAKLSWQTDETQFSDEFTMFLKEARQQNSPDISHHSEIISRSYTSENLRDLERIRLTLLNRENNTDINRLIWIAVISILRPTSSVGTAQWQYLLPNKKKIRVADPFEALEIASKIIFNDIKSSHLSITSSNVNPSRTNFIPHDVRVSDFFPEKVADLIITSPPYANNYDYADATRLEMTFLKEIESWSDLQGTIRTHLVRACTQHVSSLESKTFEIVSSPELSPIFRELLQVCDRLNIVRHEHGGKKQYHTMLAYYFLDMAKSLYSMRKVSKDGVRVCMVVGDSAPYGVYAPVDKWLGEIALSVGFKTFRFEKIRDRNTKWKNRKHTVPLKEGYLWIEG